MKKRDVAIAVWMLLCAVAPATQIDWTKEIAVFALLMLFAGWLFGVAFGQWAAQKQLQKERDQASCHGVADNDCRCDDCRARAIHMDDAGYLDDVEDQWWTKKET